MRIVRAALVLAITLPFLACSSSRIQTDFDHQADFSAYSTFAWYQATENDGPTQGPSQIIDGRIRRAIAENLQARGFSQVEPSEADLSVTLRSTPRRNSIPPAGATAGAGGRTGGLATASGRVGRPPRSTPTTREPSSSTSSIGKRTSLCGEVSQPESLVKRATRTKRSTNQCHEFSSTFHPPHRC